MSYTSIMGWDVKLKESAIADLVWFGKKVARRLLEEIVKPLAEDPLTETRNLKTLRPNPVAHRELRLFARYRILFNVDEQAQEVTIILVGEKRGNALIVQGEEFVAPHESNPAE